MEISTVFAYKFDLSTRKLNMHFSSYDLKLESVKIC
jgi:hypothetical protein